MERRLIAFPLDDDLRLRQQSLGATVGAEGTPIEIDRDTVRQEVARSYTADLEYSAENRSAYSARALRRVASAITAGTLLVVEDRLGHDSRHHVAVQGRVDSAPESLAAAPHHREREAPAERRASITRGHVADHRHSTRAIRLEHQLRAFRQQLIPVDW